MNSNQIKEYILRREAYCISVTSDSSLSKIYYAALECCSKCFYKIYVNNLSLSDTSLKMQKKYN